jgi:O-antigen ligase
VVLGFAIISAVLALPVALFCGSRTAIGALLLMFGWYMYQNISRGMGRIGRRTFGILSAVLGVVVIYLVAGGFLQEMLFGEGYERSTESRYLQFIFIPLVIMESPIFGYGFSRNIVDVVDGIYSLDSFFLQIAVEGGIVAFIALLTAIIRAAKLIQSIKRTASDKWCSSIASGLNMSLALGSIVSLVLNLTQVRIYVFIVIALGIALDYLIKSEVLSSKDTPAPQRDSQAVSNSGNPAPEAGPT